MSEPTMAQPDPEGREGERGVVLVLTAALMIVFMGMAAFAVDYGWLYYNQLEAKKAAEAAALAGVVNMPLPNCADPVAGTLPHDAAQAIAARNGYTDGVGGVNVSPATGDHCNQLTVNVNSSVGTFFMRVFGLDTLNIDQTATAEQIPPLKIGSDEPYLGTDPTVPGRDRDFWLATNGPRTPKSQGDPYTTNCYQMAGPMRCTGSNYEFRDPAYYYAYEVLPADAGKTISFQVFDPQLNEGFATLDRDRTSSDATGNEPAELIFRVMAPDATPNDWEDNSTLVCSRTFVRNGQGGYDPALAETWVSLCSDNAISGTYVLQVAVHRQPGDELAILNAWSLRALLDGSPNNAVQVYGLGSMSLWTPNPGSNPTFKIARVDEVYAGKELVITLWDVGDISSPGVLQFTGSLDSIDCQVRTRDDRGNTVANWHSDDGGANCQNNISVQEHNNQWLDFRFDLPGSYTCPGGDCWTFVDYSFSGNTTDRTTWSAYVNGQPIHLIP
jgi:hypothetical protein